MAQLNDIALPVRPGTAPGDGASHSADDPLMRSNLTKSQYVMWAGQKLSPEIALYNMALAFTIDICMQAIERKSYFFLIHMLISEPLQIF